MAIEEQDIEELRSAITDMKPVKLPTVAADVAAAQKELDILVCRRGITFSFDAKDIDFEVASYQRWCSIEINYFCR